MNCAFEKKLGSGAKFCKGKLTKVKSEDCGVCPDKKAPEQKKEKAAIVKGLKAAGIAKPARKPKGTCRVLINGKVWKEGLSSGYARIVAKIANDLAQAAKDEDWILRSIQAKVEG